MNESRKRTIGPYPNPEIPNFDGGGLMVPPWTKYPNIPLGSLGWRMGSGEDYWYGFRSWWFDQDSRTQQQLENKYPEPTGWDGFYERLRDSKQ